ncbi:DEAD/DEAH box helicase [archaeon]|nr:MAG: DEAD/DEAH box helicase [archaeon]
MLIVRKLPGKSLSIELNLLRGAKKVNRATPSKYFIDFRREGERLSIAKFRGEAGILQPKVATEMIRKNLVYISKDAETAKLQSELVAFFRRIGTQVYLIDLCRFCAIEGYITAISKRYALRHGERICLSCAKKEIEREMKFRNIAFSDKILAILKRVRDVDRVIRMFDPATDVMRDGQLTLLDSMPADTRAMTVSVDAYPLPSSVRSYVQRAGIEKFMPVQVLALEKGLLDGQSLLVASATASGKTLIAEMAGIMSVSAGRKFIFLTPLVALANQKYGDFRKRWGKRHSVSIRVGMSRIKSADDLVVIDSDLAADIIVGTYEGLDYVLRSGMDIGEIGCVVIDEVHMLSDPERGYRLAGLITRLRTLHPRAQIIGLSATIGNAAELAEDLELTPVVYDKRPIPLERHLIFKDEGRKKEVIKRIVKKEWDSVSEAGYHGQTMVFTNSRLKCSQLASYLNAKGLSAASYHSGLSYAERVKIERAYWKQRLQCIVTTAALSAGVDFPSSAVVLESMVMGAEPLRVGEFHQMLGRAGRPGFHERGKVYLLVDPLKTVRGESEDVLAFSLIEGSVEDVELVLTPEQEKEDLIACYATGHRPIDDFNEHAIWPLPLEKRGELREHGVLKGESLTPFGRAIAQSFLSVEDALRIRKGLSRDPLDVAISLLPFENVYLTSALQSMLDTNSARLFSGEVLEKIEDADAISSLPVTAQETALKIVMEFFTCSCDTPFCEHPPQEVSRQLLDLRMGKSSPRAISSYFSREFGLQLYAGDIFSYLDQVIHKLEAVERIALAVGDETVAKRARSHIRKIEG